MNKLSYKNILVKRKLEIRLGYTDILYSNFEKIMIDTLKKYSLNNIEIIDVLDDYDTEGFNLVILSKTDDRKYEILFNPLNNEIKINLNKVESDTYIIQKDRVYIKEKTYQKPKSNCRISKIYTQGGKDFSYHNKDTKKYIEYRYHLFNENLYSSFSLIFPEDFKFNEDEFRKNLFLMESNLRTIEDFYSKIIELVNYKDLLIVIYNRLEDYEERVIVYKNSLLEYRKQSLKPATLNKVKKMFLL